MHKTDQNGLTTQTWISQPLNHNLVKNIFTFVQVNSRASYHIDYKNVLCDKSGSTKLLHVSVNYHMKNMRPYFYEHYSGKKMYTSRMSYFEI